MGAQVTFSFDKFMKSLQKWYVELLQRTPYIKISTEYFYKGNISNYPLLKAIFQPVHSWKIS